MGSNTSQTVTVTNTGSAALSIATISFSGANAALFSQTSNCSSALAVNGSCTIYVTYTPTATTSASATLSIASDASNSPSTVTITAATAVAQSLTFGYTGSVQTYTVPNGVYALTLQASGAGGGGAAADAGGAGGAGGNGAKASGTYATTPGSVLNLYVGSGGLGSYTSQNAPYTCAQLSTGSAGGTAGGSGGFAGGVGGMAGCSGWSGAGAGGGAASVITTSSGTSLLIAGGGGGGQGGANNIAGLAGGAASATGALPGSAGGVGAAFSGDGGGGGGGGGGCAGGAGGTGHVDGSSTARVTASSGGKSCANGTFVSNFQVLRATGGAGGAGQSNVSLPGSAGGAGSITISVILGPDHFSVTHASTGINCQAEPFTIQAHNSGHAAMSTTDTISVTTSTGHGDWTLTSGAGTFIAGSSNSGTASYTYAAGDNGQVVLSLRDTYPETTTVNIADGSITQTSGAALASENTSITFVASGFRITNGSNVATSIGTQQAGVSSSQSLALQAIRTDTNTGACTAAFASGATVNVPMAYQCNNPTSCVAGQSLSVTNNGTTTSIASNPNSGITTYTNVPLKFSTANAEAPITLKYSDVGQITLAEKYAIPLGSGAGSLNYMLGSSRFVVQPYGFTVSNIKCTSYAAGSCNTGLASPGNNPGASTAAGTVFMPGGAPFTATVTAVNEVGAATPNFGQEISPATVTLSPTLVLPVSGHTGTITNGSAFGAFSAGVATGTTFAWPEAGIITLSASTTSAYLGTSVVTGAASGNVGRFIPARFNTAANTPVLGTACIAGGYSYLGQPLTYTVAPVLTATAVAFDGTTVAQNYTGSLMRMTNSTLTGRTYTPTPAAPALDTSGLPATSVDPAIADLGAGNVSLTFGSGTGLKFSRSTVVAPFSANIALSINVIDADGVTAASNPVTVGSGSGISFSSGAIQRYGRLNLADALGSELLDLPMGLTTQYYLNSTVGFVTNTADSCTPAPALTFSSYQLHLVAGKTCVRDTGNPGVSGQGCAAAANLSQRYAATASSGSFNLNLSAPGTGYSGAVTVTVTATAPAWLQYTWVSGGGYSSPTGMATFGIYPGPASRVHQREVY